VKAIACFNSYKSFLMGMLRLREINWAILNRLVSVT